MGSGGGLDAGQLALLLLACGGIAVLVGVIAALHYRDSFRGLVACGLALVAIIPVALLIVGTLKA